MELGFTLLKIPQKATSMFTGLEEEQAAPHTKTGLVMYATGKHLAFCVMVTALNWISFSGS